eukprot:Plantae.Rhodophyta-Purpureofilum_apyrenoidigerum.ctg22987.p1 GENE.Plantae.Rhodophyta-Purpureofilum_apyrenoidigerum.ctg22987~~Plantae.Rhodophyta-Purpureofilum_apyrenoidigerum.ctg22987.p1  ORF type:complete len:189 (-),score=63.22 Plantae.Rhodophyta-Purpureofilum_apyrenoidigerum.ctg22987:60-626(-)
MGDVQTLRSKIEEARRALDEEETLCKEAEVARERLKKQAAVLSQLGETEEEYISNKLITLLQNCKAEKEKLALQIEQEEEYLTNTLQKKLEQLKREKVEIENQMEQEQEYIVNKLQIQLEETRKEKEVLEKKIEELSKAPTSPRLLFSPRYSRSNSGHERAHDRGSNASFERVGSSNERNVRLSFDQR